MARVRPLPELHVHLEGTITPETVCELNPNVTTEEARSRYEHTDFAGFIQTYIWVNQQLRTPADYAHATRRMIEAFDRQNVKYAEVNLSAGVVLWKQQNFGEMFDAIVDAASSGTVRVRWILDAVRQFGPEAAMRVAELAAERTERGVVAFGFGGDEAKGPAEWFAEVCAFARHRGLHIAPHAGETVGPESIWAALEGGAERIGHGIRAIDDPVLVRHLADRQIPLEVSITSNLRTGAVRNVDDHPIRRLFDAGVPITLNSDDPGIFGTTLSDEYRIAAEHFGFSEHELDGVARNGFRFAFDAEEI
jgi:aminodeoxyfutalosine deaminase